MWIWLDEQVFPISNKNHYWTNENEIQAKDYALAFENRIDTICFTHIDRVFGLNVRCVADSGGNGGGSW